MPTHPRSSSQRGGPPPGLGGRGSNNANCVPLSHRPAALRPSLLGTMSITIKKTKIHNVSISNDSSLGSSSAPLRGSGGGSSSSSSGLGSSSSSTGICSPSPPPPLPPQNPPSKVKKSSSGAPPVLSMNDDDGCDYQAELEKLLPSAELSVELPFQGNGNMYQIRTTLSGEVFQRFIYGTMIIFRNDGNFYLDLYWTGPDQRQRRSKVLQEGRPSPEAILCLHPGQQQWRQRRRQGAQAEERRPILFVDFSSSPGLEEEGIGPQR